MALKLKDNGIGDFLIKEYDVLKVKKCQYLIEKFLGEGSYGVVAQSVNLDTSERIALKIVKKNEHKAGEIEHYNIKRIKEIDPEKNNLVKLIDHFKYKGYICLAFEMLDISLFDYMKTRHFKPVGLSELRVIAQQMLVSLNALKGIGMVHADIKPDNVMLVNHELHPFKVKLIDFGLARLVSEMPRGSIIQALGYRAPEVILGLPLSEAVDMWALGCVLAFMYLGQHLYPTDCAYEVMRVIIQIHGQPDDNLLNSGASTAAFFNKAQGSDCPSWRLNTHAEYNFATGSMPRRKAGVFDSLTSLDDLVKFHPGVSNSAEYEDILAFISLLKCMLQVDPNKRISPSNALGHRFITMKHLSDDSYATSALKTVTESKLEEPPFECERFITSSEVVSFTPSIPTLSDDLSSDNLPAAITDLDDATTAGTEEKLPDNDNKGEVDEVISILIIPGRSSPEKEEELINCSDNEGLVEVKSRKKWLQKVKGFFSRMGKCLRCCRDDTIPKHNI